MLSDKKITSIQIDLLDYSFSPFYKFQQKKSSRFLTGPASSVALATAEE